MGETREPKTVLNYTRRNCILEYDLQKYEVAKGDFKEAAGIIPEVNVYEK
jgi:hypothetical protein